jgi:glycosyltransferase involved in cell wall biosynthesis
MKILFLTDNFPPEFNAPATRTYEHCKEWIRLGAEVTVITCAPNFPSGKVFDGYKNVWRSEERVDGIKVIRVWSYISANQGFFKRTLDFVSFALTSFLAGLFIKTDIIVATSPQFFTAVSGCALGIFKQKKWVMEVRDIWPESIKAVDAVKSAWVIAFLEKIELFLYKSAYKIVVVTDSFKENLVQRGVSKEKVFVIKNGVDLAIYKPSPKNIELTKTLGIQGKFVIGYIGTHGLAHSLDFIVKSISKLNDQSYHFLFIGEGAEKKNVKNLAEELALANITFIDPVKKSEIPKYLTIVDVALVPLKKSTTFESVIPSKVFEAVAMNVPILLGVDGETRRIIESYYSGLYFEPENEIDFIEKMKLMKALISKGNNPFADGCQKMASDFNRDILAKKMLDVLSNN